MNIEVEWVRGRVLSPGHRWGLQDPQFEQVGIRIALALSFSVVIARQVIGDSKINLSKLQIFNQVKN